MARLAAFLSRIARRIFLREHEFGFADDERILLRDSVSFRTKFYGDHGPLILTDRRLSFRARDYRVTGGKPRIDVPLTDIVAVSVRKRKKGVLHALAGDAISVELKDSKSYEFETSFPDVWEKRVNEEIGKIAG